MSKFFNPLADVGQLIEPFPGQWVTLSSDKKKVVGHSKRMQTALNQAYNKGVENSFLIKSPDGNIAAFIY